MRKALIVHSVIVADSVYVCNLVCQVQLRNYHRRVLYETARTVGYGLMQSAVNELVVHEDNSLVLELCYFLFPGQGAFTVRCRFP